MILHVIATLCSIANPNDCREQEVTNSQLADVSMISCGLGAPAMAEFMKSFPQYQLMKWSCQMGERGVKL